MKRPPLLTPAKRPSAKRVMKNDPLEDLQARLEQAELDATFNPRTDLVSLDELFVLLMDMTAAVTAHGSTPDEAFAKVDPGEGWKSYLGMWREQHLRLDALLTKYALDDDGVYRHSDAVAAGLEKRERLAWRVFLCQRAVGEGLADQGLRARLEVLRTVAKTPGKRAA